MEQALKPNPTARLARSFSALLDEHFGEEESRRSLKPPSSGPLRGIFDYDAATGKLTLPRA